MYGKYKSGYPLPCLSEEISFSAVLPADRVGEARSSLSSTKERVRLAYDTMGRRRWRSRIELPKPDWAYHVPRPRVASRAYYKLWEILHVNSVLSPPLTHTSNRTLHLCEAPGGFVECVVDVFGGTVDYFATSLTRPLDGAVATFSPSVSEERILKSGVRTAPSSSPSSSIKERDRGWSEDDLRDADVRTYVVDAVGGRSSCWLVTGDGAEVDDHAFAEEQTLDLVRAQLDVALRVLCPGGVLVLKAFECLTPDTLAVVETMCRHFEEVVVHKPYYSRPTNSERYLVGLRRTLAPEESEATPEWRRSVASIMSGLARDQVKCLKDALLGRRPSYGRAGDVI